MIDADALRRFFAAYLAAVEREQDALDRLDAVAGDGDHGATMVLGMRALVAALPPATAPASAADVLRAAAEGFGSVGGSIGPLWGTGLLRAARAVDAGAPLGTVAAATVEGLRDRGGAALGDKTLLDVMEPAVAAFAGALDTGVAPGAALTVGLAGARVGLETSAALPARRGRARRLVERSVGATDPGAASACLAWETAAALYSESATSTSSAVG
jgi:dihydroxyacetone kinase